MCTVEIRRNHAMFNSLEIKHCNMLTDDEVYFDPSVSLVVLNEQKDILAKVIASPINKPHQHGRGCYISEIQYPDNLEGFMRTDVLSTLISSAMYKIIAIDGNIGYAYDYIWFHTPPISNSILSVFYPHAEIHEGVCVFRFQR